MPIITMGETLASKPSKTRFQPRSQPDSELIFFGCFLERTYGIYCILLHIEQLRKYKNKFGPLLGPTFKIVFFSKLLFIVANFTADVSFLHSTSRVISLICM